MLKRKRLAAVNCGEFYAIPLFLSEFSESQRFTKDDFMGDDKKYCYCRIIDDKGVGIIIEVFNLVGNLSVDLMSIVNSGRLFDPVQIVGLGIYKKRWQKIGMQDNYDRERDSKLSEIRFVYPPLPGGLPRLWENGQEREISFQESERYEPSRIWSAQHLEKRIIETLKARGAKV